MRENTASVLAYWFGDDKDDAAVIEDQSSLWWDKHPGVDAEIRARFSELRQEAIDGYLTAWASSPRGRLALIVLVSCFSRNLHRNSRAAFEYDELASRWCREGIKQGQDRALRSVEKMFFYIPLQYSERAGDQDLAVTMYSTLVQDAAPAHRKQLNCCTADVYKQRDVISRFGRFPYRNVLLNRNSTVDEIKFMAQSMRYI